MLKMSESQFLIILLDFHYHAGFSPSVLLWFYLLSCPYFLLYVVKPIPKRIQIINGGGGQLYMQGSLHHATKFLLVRLFYIYFLKNTFFNAVTESTTEN